jgi:peptidoglycan hydrolase-like protein with peptidoglycan-binding domain
LVIRDAEQHLISLGYKPLSTDGVLGARAIAAIKSFQTNHGLPVTGKLDRKTLDALRVKVIPGATVAPNALFDFNVKLIKGTEVRATGLLEYGGNSASLTVANGEFDILLDERGNEMGRAMDGKPVQVRGVITGEFFTTVTASFSSPFSGSISRGKTRIPQIRVIDFKPVPATATSSSHH